MGARLISSSLSTASRLVASSASSWSSGGYTLELPFGLYDVTVSGGDVGPSEIVSLSLTETDEHGEWTAHVRWDADDLGALVAHAVLAEGYAIVTDLIEPVDQRLVIDLAVNKVLAGLAIVQLQANRQQVTQQLLRAHRDTAVSRRVKGLPEGLVTGFEA